MKSIKGIGPFFDGAAAEVGQVPRVAVASTSVALPSVIVSGAWKSTTEAYVLVGGAWKAVTEVHVIVGGVFKAGTT